MKTAYDTCLYVDFLRDGKWSDLFRNRSHIRFLSPVVLMELNAGANTALQKKALDQLFYPYSKAQRIIRIEAAHFYRAGEILSSCRHKLKPILRGFSHDVLLAVSAASIGATLFTRDHDFELIRRHLPVDIEML